MNSATLATWVGSIATGIGSIGTVGTLIVALKQLANEMSYRRETEKRAQAVKISAWIKQEIYDEDKTIHSILNKSDEPIYQVVLTVVSIQGAGFPRDGYDVNTNTLYQGYTKCLSIVPPGKFVIETKVLDYAMTMRFSLEIAFTDAAGRHWVRKSNGSLTEIKNSPIEYYNIPRPIDWSFPIGENNN